MRVSEHIFWVWTCYPAHSILQFRDGTYTQGKGLCMALQQGWGSGSHLEPCLLSSIEHGRSLAWEPPSSTWLSFCPFVLVSPAQGPQRLAPLTSHISLHISSILCKLGKRELVGLGALSCGLCVTPGKELGMVLQLYGFGSCKLRGNHGPTK